MSINCTKELEKSMKLFYDYQEEKGKRLFSAICSQLLPLGGVNYISELFNIDPKTIFNGKKELLNSNEISHRQREIGGGPKTIYSKYPNLDEIFMALIKNNTAGDQMNQNNIWTNLSISEISTLLTKKDLEKKVHKKCTK